MELRTSAPNYFVVERSYNAHQAKEFCIKRSSITTYQFIAAFLAVYLVIYWLQINTNLLTLELMRSSHQTHSQYAIQLICLLVALVLTSMFTGAQVISESLIFIPSIGINMKIKNRFGQVTADFFETNQIRDIVILEAITMQKVICYLAIILEGGERSKEQIYPLFMKSCPDLETLKVIYRDVQQLLHGHQ